MAPHMKPAHDIHMRACPPDSLRRYYWFIISFEFVVLAMAFYAVVMNAYKAWAKTLMGLFAVGTLLFMIR